MPKAEDLILFGLLLKTHGVEGQLVLKLDIFSEDELEKKEPVFIEIDGIPVPFFIKDFRFISDDAAIIRLVEVDSSTQASEFINCRVFIPWKEVAEQEPGGNINYEDLKGFRIIDQQHGDAGILQEVVDYSENTLMVIDFNDRELLVPFHENIIRSIDFDKGIIEISAPEGLFDLYL